MKLLNAVIIIYVHIYKLQFLLTFFLEIGSAGLLYSYHNEFSIYQEILVKFHTFILDLS
jgi:hypothetical protein